MKRLGAAALLRDQTGGVLVEATVMLVIIFIFVLGSVDFLMAMYQWNAAAKAVQIGARIAAVSDPVASDLNAITGLESGAIPGTFPPPAFTTRTCSGSTGTCSGGSPYSATAMNRIVRGRNMDNGCQRPRHLGLRHRHVRHFSSGPASERHRLLHVQWARLCGPNRRSSPDSHRGIARS